MGKVDYTGPVTVVYDQVIYHVIMPRHRIPNLYELYKRLKRDHDIESIGYRDLSDTDAVELKLHGMLKEYVYPEPDIKYGVLVDAHGNLNGWQMIDQAGVTRMRFGLF